MVRRVSGWVKWGGLGILLFSMCPQAQAQHSGLSSDDAKTLALGTAELLAGTGKAASAVAYIGLADTVREANEKAESDPVGAYAGIAIDIGSGVASRSMFIGGASALGMAAFCIEPAGWIPCGLAFGALTVGTKSLLKSMLDQFRDALPGVPRPTPRPAPPVEVACIPWGAKASLSGNVQLKTFPGPPNFESVIDGDQPMRIPILTLSSPICVGEDNDPDGFGVVKSIQELHVAGGNISIGDVKVSGRMSPAETAYHRTNVVLWLDGEEAQTADSTTDNSNDTADTSGQQSTPTPSQPNFRFPDISTPDLAKAFLRKVMPQNAYCDQLGAASFYCRVAQRPNSDYNSVNLTVNIESRSVVLISQFGNFGNGVEELVKIMHTAARNAGIDSNFLYNCYKKGSGASLIGNMDVRCNSFSAIGATHFMVEAKESTRF